MARYHIWGADWLRWYFSYWLALASWPQSSSDAVIITPHTTLQLNKIVRREGKMRKLVVDNCYLKLPYVKPGSSLLPVFKKKKKLRIWPPFHNSQLITKKPLPLPAFAVGDASGLHSTGKDLLQELAWLRYLSPKSSCANTLAFRATCVQPVYQYIGTPCSKC